MMQGATVGRAAATAIAAEGKRRCEDVVAYLAVAWPNRGPHQEIDEPHPQPVNSCNYSPPPFPLLHPHTAYPSHARIN